MHDIFAGNSLTIHSGIQFSTKDVDNDKHPAQCPMTFVGAWWYDTCLNSNLRGEFKPSDVTEYGWGVQWHSWRGYYYSLHYSLQMMVRPSD